MRNAYNELKDEGFDSVLERLQALAKRVGIDNVWESIATRTQLVMDRAGELADSITDWENLSGFDAGVMAKLSPTSLHLNSKGQSQPPRGC